MKGYSLLLPLVFAMNMAQAQTPPDVEKRPHTVKSPHGERQGGDYWGGGDARQGAQKRAYLQAENDYADAVLKPLKPLEDKLFDEIVSRIKQDDSSVPYREHGFWYYTRFENGKDYPVYARRAAGDGVDALSIRRANEAGDFASEEVLLDVNKLAEGHDYFSAAPVDITLDNQKMVWAEDTNGRRQYTLRVTDLAGGKLLPDTISGTNGSALWADDGKTLFYIENDPETLLSKRVKKHVLGTDSKDDVVVYEEADDSFYLSLGRTRDEAYLLIQASSTVSDEMRYADAKNPGEFKVFTPRERDVEYGADHFGGRWVIRTNADGARNFKVMTAADNATARKDWQEWIAHDPTILVEDVELFDDFSVIGERSEGLERIRILKKDGTSEYVKAAEPALSS